MRSPLESLRNAICRQRGIRMLPESKDGPSGRSEAHVRIPVPTSIRFNLFAPPNRVRPWPRAVLRTSMPEAPIDEYRDLRSNEGDIRATTRSRQRHINSITEAKRPERGTDRQLA